MKLSELLIELMKALEMVRERSGDRALDPDVSIHAARLPIGEKSLDAFDVTVSKQSILITDLLT